MRSALAFSLQPRGKSSFDFGNMDQSKGLIDHSLSPTLSPPWQALWLRRQDAL